MRQIYRYAKFSRNVLLTFFKVKTIKKEEKKSRRYQPEGEVLAAFCALQESLFRTPIGVASGTLVVVTAARISLSVLETGADCPVV